MLLGFHPQALGFSLVLFVYSVSFCTTYYGVLPQRVIDYTCAELQHAAGGGGGGGGNLTFLHGGGGGGGGGGNLSCDGARVTDLATKRIAYMNIAYSAAGALTNGPLTRFADVTSRRKAVLLWVICGLVLDQVSQIWCTSYLQVFVAHAVSGLMGNLYVSMALLFSFIADASHGMRGATPEQVQSQRRRDYGLAEGAVYAGGMLGPYLGGLLYKETKQYTVPYWFSGGMAVVLFLGVLLCQPADVRSRLRLQQQQRSLLRVDLDDVDTAAAEDDDDALVEKPKANDADGRRSRWWWNPLLPIQLMFCHKERAVWSFVLLVGWFGQKGVEFVYNPFVRYEYNSGPYLIGLLINTKAAGSIFSNLIVMRVATWCHASGPAMVLTACTMLVGAFLLVGFGGGSGSGGGGGGAETMPGPLFWVGVACSGLAAFLSPLLRSMQTATTVSEADGGEDDAFPSGGHRSRRGAVGGAVGAVSVLGGIAAIESFCDFTVPFIYGISGLWDYLVSVGRAPLVFVCSSGMYAVACCIVLVYVCGCGRRGRAS